MASSFSFDSLNQAQREAVGALDGPVMLLAGAGTGKTRTVTCRIAHMLEKRISPSEILAVTFTNKAASEMRERIGGMVSKKAADDMTVCTFHSLCVRILRGGIERLAPSLIGSEFALAPSATIPIRIVLNGKEGSVALMPPLGSTLTDDQVAAALTYIRREWGHTASAIDPAAVAETRKATASRTRPWTNDELTRLLRGGGQH